eukprot:CAMPEP_0171331838 /NCGR_PEP_ID=MMETSP0878-20121228/2971_1 /TAXON_ID=67004 /ORGANISM="Thalassiosira weissflogii, Strain CCMP1336" /LENGTH=388 /DNA_ID=CAMNT_0011832473 /DNA_START=102 /DNA_END=1268 /DNA_ORIENTATION=+
MADSKRALSTLAELGPLLYVNRRFVGARPSIVANHHLIKLHDKQNNYFTSCTPIRSDSLRSSFAVSHDRYFSNLGAFGPGDSSDESEIKNNEYTRRPRTLKCGRARRKWETRTKRSDDLTSENQNDEKVIDVGKNNHRAIEENEPSFDKSSLNEDVPENRSVSEILFGRPLEQPLREEYYRQYRLKNGLKYPKTLEKWKTLLSEAWKDYLWTFEGFLIKDSGERDAYGNIIENGKVDLKHNDASETLKDKASDVASEVASNVRKNVATIREESPKLFKMGQDITGISSKEELRNWVGEQLKLATECVGEFMKGYRRGRDEEVDKMLHQYFQELDEQQEPSGENSPVSEENNVAAKRERRTWGRRERRRKKAQSTTPESTIDSEIGHAV